MRFRREEDVFALPEPISFDGKVRLTGRDGSVFRSQPACRRWRGRACGIRACARKHHEVGVRARLLDATCPKQRAEPRYPAALCPRIAPPGTIRPKIPLPAADTPDPQ